MEQPGGVCRVIQELFLPERHCLCWGGEEQPWQLQLRPSSPWKLQVLTLGA